jgi:mannose-6-phosphate isomerase-like protein (cupin superfamily)
MPVIPSTPTPAKPHVILKGEITFSMAGEIKTFREGERCNVPAGAVHSAKMGSRGCRYVIGER